MQPHTLFKRQIPVLPIILCGLFLGVGAARLFLEHDVVAAVGFFCASGAAVLAHTYAMYASKLLVANHITCDSMTRLLADLEANGVIVERVHTEGDVELFSAKLQRKDLH
jgi:hypothetical protein